MSNELFKLDRKLLDNGTSELSLRIPIDVCKIMLENLTGNELKVYLAIAIFMDDRGECTPSQDTISSITAISKPTVNKTINSLLKKKVLNRKLVEKGNRINYSIYSVTQSIDEKLPKAKRFNARDIMKLFEDKYFEKYNIPYKANYSKDMGLIKKSLLATYTDEQIILIMDTVFAEYDKRWKTPQYQAPNVGAICSWLGNQALKLAMDKAKKDTNSKWDNIENKDEDLLL